MILNISLPCDISQNWVFFNFESCKEDFLQFSSENFSKIYWKTFQQ